MDRLRSQLRSDEEAKKDLLHGLVLLSFISLLPHLGITNSEQRGWWTVIEYYEGFRRKHERAPVEWAAGIIEEAAVEQVNEAEDIGGFETDCAAIEGD